MIANNEYGALQARLQAILSETFQQVTVQIGDDLFYHGTNLVVTTPDFAGLLPEQRFHHLVRAIPASLYEDHLRGGVVWFELAPGETPREYMRMPRSEDIADRSEAIFKRLVAARFFHRLTDRLLAAPDAASSRDFVLCREILQDAGFRPDEIIQACLFFIRHGGYCDVQVISDVVDELAGSHVEERKVPRPSPPQRKAPARSIPPTPISQQQL